MLAPAKINLSLHVTGKRSDGYHLLDSLVVFADVGDQIDVQPADNISLRIAGPEAGGLEAEADNLVLRAARLMQNKGQGAAITLTKNLPVSSGIGGGSSDAATTISALAGLWECSLPRPEDVVGLGADVPVCLAQRPARMTGIGEGVEPVADLPDMAVVLVNPRVSVSTPAVFAALERRENSAMDYVPSGMGYSAFCEWLAAQRNDLEAPACSLVPEINDVLAALEGADFARMSGSGATCFGLFETLEQASAAAQSISAAKPDWWVKAARVLP
ncbi:4-(cytidine 5'-diphospho)-2-C-methyl-D-erythritol kinase [Halocynthiibacter sp. SDUM655004]|uniref:4-diphosphocytidyl-2-C-methyl-D-erythritol kinase n=2 Tax=Paracoccaceae TaxID=31989 RepID=A0AAE3IYG4_9RHOB|nr:MULTISPECIES: 4-(cytidine 5'-diphospho)-2-C-methyl-D-erythritol kinase [Halocynthiibacter]MCV6823223.1 4-(cytidine 5'-diphospho)-2-C-methyl-D-erythritol kinase [Halocynthiibacter halioticoli]MCW4056224.1 4-(cytidine 5'-diphospho)-2-C-methyl-D-erythritol kinase [Halocynthiibacter sp. SDUM655004]